MFSLLSLLDDISATLDDVAVMTKVAIKKTSALMSDDLAVNADVVVGVSAARELPIVKSIFFGALLNKVYCILGVLLIMTVYEPILTVILLGGGIFLSYEGAHKAYEKIFLLKSKENPQQSKNEKSRINGAIRTDLILSIEIIVIAKNSLSGPMLNQVLSLIAVGLAASIIIYGLVAAIVKIDDFGVFLIKKGYEKIGLGFVNSMPFIMKSLGIIGTTAMFLVGGGIVMHIFHLPMYAPELVQSFVIGLFVGGLALTIMKIVTKFLPKKAS